MVMRLIIISIYTRSEYIRRQSDSSNYTISLNGANIIIYCLLGKQKINKEK